MGKKMNLLIFSQYYYPERFLINEIAEGFARDGDKVTVITGKPCYNYPQGKIPREYQKIKEETINGVRVIRTKILNRGTSAISIILYYFSFMINACFSSKKYKEQPDYIFLYQLTPILQAFPAIRYAKKHRKPLVCYCLDIAPECGMSEARKIKLLKYLYTKFSKWAYQNCDAIAVTSRAFTEYLKNVHSITKEKIYYVPQHAPSNLVQNDSLKKYDVRAAHFMFAGNLGVGARLDTIILAAKELVDKGYIDFVVHFVGEGSGKTALEECVSKNNMNSYVIFHCGVPFDKMPEIYELADALLITLRKGQITAPGKLQAYMMTGKPILGAMDGSGKDMIEEVGCGKCVEALDYRGLASLMEEYIMNPAPFEILGRKGRKFVSEELTLDKYINSIRNIAGAYMKEKN